LDGPDQRKVEMTSATWNFRSFYMESSSKAARRELAKYKLILVEVQEVRWEEDGFFLHK